MSLQCPLCKSPHQVITRNYGRKAGSAAGAVAGAAAGALGSASYFPNSVRISFADLRGFFINAVSQTACCAG